MGVFIPFIWGVAWRVSVLLLFSVCVCLAHAIIIAQAVYNYSKQQQQLLKKLCKANVVGGQKGKEKKKEKEQGRGASRREGWEGGRGG